MCVFSNVKGMVAIKVLLVAEGDHCLQVALEAH